MSWRWFAWAAGDGMAKGKRNRWVMVSCLGIVLGMTALSFAAVPLYDLFCRVTGFGGTTQQADATTGQIVDRTVRVE